MSSVTRPRPTAAGAARPGLGSSPGSGSGWARAGMRRKAALAANVVGELTRRDPDSVAG